MTLDVVPLVPEPAPFGIVLSRPHITETTSRVMVWARGMAVAGLVGTMTLGVIPGDATSGLKLAASTVTPQVKGELPRPTSDSAATAVRSTGELVSRLHQHSGLTWDQLGRLMGVSRRTMHLWAAGKRMNGRNAELLADILRIVDAAPGTSPDERRSWLFSPTSDGLTPLERFLNQHRQPGLLTSASGYTPAELLGITTQ